MLRLFCCWLLRLFLSLRYRVRVLGLDKVRSLKGPTLVLPNHPAYVDPMILFSQLWPVLRPRPMAYENNFYNPLLWPIIKLIDAVPVPDLEKANAQARDQAREAVQSVIEGLHSGRNHIMWPSGRLERAGYEVLGGARALTEILAAVPDANIVLVRTRGLWGSRFSYARTGKAPSLLGGLFAGIGYIVSNLILFTPRRPVTITVELLDRSRLPELRRELINPWFEKWYNTESKEQPTHVPYHFLFGSRKFDFPGPEGLSPADLAKVQPETRTGVNQLLEEKLHRPLSEQEHNPETTLDQLGLDSLDRMELTLAVESQFGFSGEQVPTNLGQLYTLAQGLAKKGTQRPPPPLWFRPLSEEGPLEILGETVAEAFVNRALANRQDVIVVDDLSGALNYQRLLVGVVALSRRLAQLPADNLGLLLPASVACDMAFLAMHLAGKLPVILNWTTGTANLEHAARIMNLRHVITSQAFINRTSIEVKGVEYVFMEDLRSSLGKLELLRLLFRVSWQPGSLRRLVPRGDPEKPAVVLFTSGSEKAPKAVPLTHRNLFSDHRAGISFLELTRKDTLLAFLPAFHSFGLSVTGVLPLTTGLRMVRHPDPTDAGGLLRKIEAYQTTLLVGTPTFVSYIVDRAKPGQLDSLRLIVVGAEKCPESLFTRCLTLASNAVLLEGYGITECSPVVSVNPPRANRPGTIGKALPGVELCVVDLDSDAVLPPGKLGMLLVGGPTVFPGYIGHDGPSPFRERDGKRWYVTGDLAAIDEDGYVHFGGRLKRFLKVGGEMVSLPALEEPFIQRFPPTKEGPQVAIEGRETETGRRLQLVLFTTQPLTLAEANRVLTEAGFTGLMRLDEVRQVAAIPVLGTGKTDYKVLRAMLTPAG